MKEISICYGEDDGSIYTEEGMARLWKEENIVYLGDVHAFKVIPRENNNPLIQMCTEDDGLITGTEDCFDAEFLSSLQSLIEATIEKLK